MVSTCVALDVDCHCSVHGPENHLKVSFIPRWPIFLSHGQVLSLLLCGTYPISHSIHMHDDQQNHQNKPQITVQYVV